MNNGWIKLYRDLLEKPIWLNSTPEQKTVLITVLMLANHDENEWDWNGKKFKVGAGQFVTSLPKLAEKCGDGISIQNVRTALKRFEKLEFLTDESTATGRVITIVNWGIYQGCDGEPNRPSNSCLTEGQQTPNRGLTANKNDKNVRMKECKNNIHTAAAVRIDYQHYVDLYNSHCSSLPQVKTLNDKRKRLIKKVAREVSENDLLTAFNKANTNPFLRGDNGGWKANFDWLMNPDNITKVLEGNYDRTTTTTNKTAQMLDDSYDALARWVERKQ